jgi:hydroxymethylbilane synthase
MNYKIASRGSRLALRQAEMVRDLLEQKFPEHRWQIETFTTTGDKFLDKPVYAFGGKGAFLKEIEDALLQGGADLAVHSLKDVPSLETPGLMLTAFLAREDPRDVWVCNRGEISMLTAGSIVGTSSLRRTTLLNFYRSDLKVEMLRGNLDTRLRKWREGRYDAIVVAAAGLHRLNLFDESSMQYLFEDAFIPAVGQGVLVIQTSETNQHLAGMARQLNDSQTETAARIERKFLAMFEGGCHLPIGAFAVQREEKWQLRAFIGGVKSHRLIQAAVQESDPEGCADSMYRQLQSEGASNLLAELQS